MISEHAYALGATPDAARGFPGLDTLLRVCAACRASRLSWWIVRIDGVPALVAQSSELPRRFAVATPARLPRFLDAIGVVDAAAIVIRAGAGLSERGCAVTADVDARWAKIVEQMPPWTVEVAP